MPTLSEIIKNLENWLEECEQENNCPIVENEPSNP